jgi:hypothetical protein
MLRLRLSPSISGFLSIRTLVLYSNIPDESRRNLVFRVYTEISCSSLFLFTGLSLQYFAHKSLKVYIFPKMDSYQNIEIF